MKIFLDSGDVEAIRRATATGLLDGVTTNPSIVAKTGRPFREIIQEICEIVPGPVNAEAMAETAEGMVEEAQNIAAVAPNIVVKIPMTVEGLRAVPLIEKRLNIPTNVTMVFSATQALLAMKAGASYLSIVLGRLDAIGTESEVLVEDTMLLKENYDFGSQVIAGSMKTQNHVHHCFRAGLDIVTVPETLFFQMFEHPLTTIALETFAKDWENVPR